MPGIKNRLYDMPATSPLTLSQRSFAKISPPVLEFGWTEQIPSAGIVGKFGLLPGSCGSWQKNLLSSNYPIIILAAPS